MTGETESLDVSIPAGEVVLSGELRIPAGATAVVLFAHGSGSGRGSARNNSVAERLRASGIGTLLVDLLSPDELDLDSRTGGLRFDIDLLAARVGAATDWLCSDARTKELAIGYFGASTGAAAALKAAAERGNSIKAIVSRGGRPDLALNCLQKVRAPTLLIVGGADVPIIPLNQEALSQLNCEKDLTVVPGASHLFEEEGALDAASTLAEDWFKRHLGPKPGDSA